MQVFSSVLCLQIWQSMNILLLVSLCALYRWEIIFFFPERLLCPGKVLWHRWLILGLQTPEPVTLHLLSAICPLEICHSPALVKHILAWPIGPVCLEYNLVGRKRSSHGPLARMQAFIRLVWLAFLPISKLLIGLRSSLSIQKSNWHIALDFQCQFDTWIFFLSFFLFLYLSVFLYLLSIHSGLLWE